MPGFFNVTPFAALVFLASLACTPCRAADPLADEAAIRKAVTLYASFDQRLEADVGGGGKTVSTRADDPQNKGQHLITPGFPEHAFRIASGGGVAGGALEAVDVLPNRGRLFFPAAGNIAYRPGGWSGSVSCWLRINPDTMLKTKFCDPVQITQKPGRATAGSGSTSSQHQTARTCGSGIFQAR